MQNNTNFIDIEPRANTNLTSRYMQTFLDEYGYYDNELFDEDNFHISVEEM